MALLTGLTIEDFEQLPDALARNHELVKGELVDVSGNVFNHNGLRDVLVEVLRPYVREHKLGVIVSEQEFEFEDEVAYGPDVSFFGPEKAKRVDGRLRVQRFVPDLVVEIASKTDKFDTLIEKALYYRRRGVKEVYLFSIQNRQVFRYSDGPTMVLSDNEEFRPEQIPGFSIRISDLLAMI